MLGRSLFVCLNDDIASLKPKSNELEGEELCCLSNANNRRAVTACTDCLSTARSKGVYMQRNRLLVNFSFFFFPCFSF